MDTLKEIKKRVTSVKNTQKITNAMKLVASAKFNRAHKAVKGARPYSEGITDVLGYLLAQGLEHPFLLETPEHRILVLVFTSDRGLCGALNANLLKHLTLELKQRYGADFATKVDFIALGRKAEQFCQRQGLNVLYSKHNIEQIDHQVWQHELLAELVACFSEKKYDAVYLSYQLFVSALKQTPAFARILPVSADTKQSAMFLLEPRATDVMELTLYKYAANLIYKAILNSIASEHRSRMNAMDNATNNAKKVVKELTLKYNRGRQAAITKELIEITAGVQAL